MSAGRLGSPRRQFLCRTAAATLLAVFVAGVGPAPAQQASGALAVSVTVVRSATIDVPTSPLLSGALQAQTAGASVSVRPGTSLLPTAPARTTLPSAGSKGGVPVVTPSTNGRTLSIQF
jgi:hypothetical protein